jgi:hypothetical protein
MKKLLLLVSLVCACGGTSAESSKELWHTSVHSSNIKVACNASNSLTFKFVVANVLTKQVCATVFASSHVGELGTQELSADQVYSCSVSPGNKEVAFTVFYDGKELPLVPSVLDFGDYPSANRLYLNVTQSSLGVCKNSEQALELNANWSLL